MGCRYNRRLFSPIAARPAIDALGGHATRSLHLRRHPPRVAILSSVHGALDPRIFHRQARTLATAGFDVHLLAAHPRTERRDGVRIDALPAPRGRWGRPLLWLRLAARTVRLRPSAIHIHDPELLPLLLLLRWLTGAAAIYDAHEYYAAEVARRTWIPRPLRRPAARLTDAVESFVARRIEAVVAVNEHMAAGFRRRRARAIAVHNYPRAEYFGLGGDEPAASEEPGTERRELRSREGSLPPAAGGSPPLVLYVGLLSMDRGLATVYTAGRLLRGRVPGATVRAIGRVDWSGLPRDIPRDPGAWRAAGVDLAGAIPATDVPAALAGATVGWIPFRDTANNRRTIPLKLLEYMAAGLPVVASDLGYIAAIVRDAACGVLVPPDDAAAHAAALAGLLTDPVRASRLGAAGRRAVLDRYTWEPEGEKLVRLYKALMRDA